MGKAKSNVVSMGHNQIDNGLVKSAVAEIEAEQIKIDEIMDVAKRECGPLRDKIKEIKKQAADEGMAKKPLNAVISRNRFQAKADKAGAALNDDAAHEFSQMCLALDGKAA